MTSSTSDHWCQSAFFPSSKSVLHNSSLSYSKSTKTFSSMMTGASKWRSLLWTPYWPDSTKIMRNWPKGSSFCAKKSAKSMDTSGLMERSGSTSWNHRKLRSQGSNILWRSLRIEIKKKLRKKSLNNKMKRPVKKKRAVKKLKKLQSDKRSPQLARSHSTPKVEPNS